MDIRFEQLQVQTTASDLSIEQWQIDKGQSWAIFSTDGDVGALIGDLLCGELEFSQGSITTNNLLISQVSLSQQQRLLEAELANDDTDFLDRVDTGSSVQSLIEQVSTSGQLTETLINELDLVHLKQSGFRELSTGETRRVMLARALAVEPDFLVLDEPYAGLDIEHRQTLQDYLQKLSQRITLILTVSREQEIPGWVDHIALFDKGTLVEKMDRESWINHPVISQIKAQSEATSAEIMELMHKYQHNSPFADPLFELTEGRVAYTEKTIFSGVNWRINNGEHWQIRGPNGCGKSTLLGLIFGDHPQCYSNDIKIFGRQRGSGETIWQIKQHIGMVSSSLHLQYRVNCAALDVVLSGFYDSIGLYSQPTKKEVEIAKEWLAILHMTHLEKVSFRQLDYSQQRLLLIARALVKQPALLILDEPYQGLDYFGRRLVMSTLDIIARENLSQLLYVSHYEEDSLSSIHNYVDFIAQSDNQGYLVEIRSEQPA